jgi:putative transcriptional regulator
MTNDTESKTPKLHHYRDCGLDNVWIKGGFDEVDSPYGPGIAIHDLDGLHRCIAHCLVEKPGPLTGREFRFLRTELDLSQSMMGALCGREERMVRYWETRDEFVEEPANFIIRFVYTQRFNPTASFEGLSKKIRELQVIDKEIHEMKLKSTAEGWQPIDCEQQDAA